MAELRDIFLEAAGHLVAIMALVAVLFSTTKIPRLKEALGRGRPETTHLLTYSLFWIVMAVSASTVSYSSNFVPFFAGFHGGPLAGYCVGAALGGWLGWKGASVISVVLAVVAGVLGGHLSQQRRLPILPLSLLATLLGTLGFHDPQAPRDIWLFADLLRHEPGHLVAVTLTLFVTNTLFANLVEYHLRVEQRERSQSSDLVIQMVDDVREILEKGLTPEAASDLIPRIRQTLGVPGTALYVDGRVVSFSGHKPLPDLSPPDSDDTLRMIGGDYDQVYWLALDDSEKTLAYLALLSTKSEPFARWLPATAEALRTVVNGWLTRLRAEEQRADLEATRFRFLQAQIRPHFLFNTLNTVVSLSKSEEVRETVTDLSVLLRESFRQDGTLVTLEQELDLARRYLRIEKQRFGDRLQVDFECAEPLPNLRLPAFTLQPLVENAVQHGLSSKEEGGRILVRVIERDEGTEIQLSDDGLGMSSERLGEVLGAAETATVGIGVNSVRERLQTVFGDALSFQVKSELNEGTEIVIKIEL